MSRAPSEATSRSILLLIVYSLIDEKYAQQRLPGIDHCQIPWPGSCVTGQLTPQTRRFHFDETFDSSHSLLLPQQFENSSELSLTDVYDHHCNDHLENLVIPLAIIQGFRHAVATGKNSTRVNMSPPRQLDPSPTQNALTKPDIVKEVKIPMIHHHNEAGMADLESRDTKVRFKYGRAASDWDNDAVKVDSQTNDANERKMSSTCNEVGAPCCLNAVDFIACLLSNLSNATNASLLEEKEPLIKLSGIDSTMLNEKKLEKPLELMVSVKPKIWQVRYGGSQPVILNATTQACKREFVLLSDINSGLLFAVHNQQKRREEGHADNLHPGIDLTTKSSRREAIPSRSLSVCSDVKYEVDPKMEKLRYSIGITVGGNNSQLGMKYRPNPSMFFRSILDNDENDATWDAEQAIVTIHNALEKKENEKGGTVQSQARNMARDSSRHRYHPPDRNSLKNLIIETIPGKHDKNPIDKKLIGKSDFPVRKEAVPLDQNEEEATDEEFKKYKEWFSHKKSQPNQFCLAFPLIKSQCAQWLTGTEGRGAREKRREAVDEDQECRIHCIPVSVLNSRGRTVNAQYPLALCYLNSSFSENHAYGTPYKPLTTYKYSKGFKIPQPKSAPVVNSILPSCFSRAVIFDRNVAQSRDIYLHESNLILEGRPPACLPTNLKNPPLLRLSEPGQYQYSPYQRNCAIHYQRDEAPSQKVADTPRRVLGIHYPQYLLRESQARKLKQSRFT